MQKIFFKWLIPTACLILIIVNVSIFFLFIGDAEERGISKMEGSMDYALKNTNMALNRFRSIHQNLEEETLSKLEALDTVLNQIDIKKVKDSENFKKIIAQFGFKHVSVSDRSGKIVLSSNPEQIGRIMRSVHKIETFDEHRDQAVFDAQSLENYLLFEKGTNVGEYTVELARKNRNGLIQTQQSMAPFLDRLILEKQRSSLSGLKIGEKGLLLLLGGQSQKVILSTYRNLQGLYLKDAGLKVKNMPERGAFEAEFEDLGKVLCYRMLVDSKIGTSLIGILPFSELYQESYFLMFWTFLIFLLTSIVIFCINSFLIKKIVISGIKKTNATLQKIGQGDLEQTVDVYTNPEFTILSDGINEMVSSLRTMMQERMKKVERELEFAHEIQMSVVPGDFSYQDDDGSFSVFARMLPAKEVGGDFYDSFSFGENNRKKCVVIADVSDKGVPAAMCMMSAKSIIKQLVEQGNSPADTLSKANKELEKNNKTGTFVTVFIGVLDVKTGDFVYANGGHNPPYIQDSKGKIQLLDVKRGCLVGAFQKAKFENQTLKLFGNERFLLYTDGVTEAQNENSEMFEKDRLLGVLEKIKGLEGKEVIPHILNEIYQFRGDAKQSDDITLLTFSYKKGVDKA
ncbi:MAG: SpoIIE family protein phosphatase [Alphaproteobacteria bacterium]|nr:SpoIIE family protein phosphatase [Alphaproteobacteria bacterium]